ncbi:2-oxoglutarate dehydrogenase E2 component (dihydrolipoamide succinyltransferase) [Pseudoxanthomonas sp. SORGH_AS 997]|nr:2-oxoglutarate dehydrogenase E2 component (dihydrolipoamide succinyltransferase) [Pseudoxanthomonas sp. SORGH_AS_0997]
MATEVKVPVLPESVSDATIASWHKKAGEAVKRDENLVDLETDKVVLEVPSPVDGVLKEIKFAEGDTVTSSQVLAIIEEGAAAQAAPAKPAEEEVKPAAKSEAPAKAQAPAPAKAEAPKAAAGTDNLPPGARFTAITQGVDPAQVEGTGRRGAVTKEDIVKFAAGGGVGKAAGARPEERVPMTRIRKTIAKRLMDSKNSTAMLTTFNEVNLAKVSAARKELQDEFQKAHGIKLGFMSFFVKAAANALQRFPLVNASIDGEDIVYHGYSDISIAVSTDKGLVTPVLRNVERQSFAEVEQGIADYAAKARARQAGPGRSAGRHLHHHQRRHLRLAAVHPDRQPAAERHPGHARHQGAPDRRERPGRDRADDVHRPVLRPPHHRRQGLGAVPGGHQEPAGEPGPDVVRSVRAGIGDSGLGIRNSVPVLLPSGFYESRISNPESRIP